MNILITGATSFIGRQLIEMFSNQEHTIYAVVRKQSNKIHDLKKQNNINIVELDMNEYQDIANSVKDSIDVVYHLAWNGTRNPERLDQAIQQDNYDCSKRLIDACLQMKVKKIVGIGSQAEYGFVDGTIDEGRTCNPNTMYGIYKEKTCSYLLKRCKEMNCIGIWSRVFSVYGPNDYEGTLMSTLIENMQKNKTIELTLCTQNWDYLYIDDLIHYLYLFATKEVSAGIYNLASGETKQLKEYITFIKKAMESNSDLKFGAKPYGKEGVVNLAPNVKKVQNELAWKVEKPFEIRFCEMMNILREKH